MRQIDRSCRRALVLDHYRALFGERDFWTPVRNSLVVAGSTTVAVASSSARCARTRWRGSVFAARRWCWRSCSAVSMFPQISIVSPLYLLLRALRLLDTYPGLVLPYLTFAMPLTIWLLVGFFRQLPRRARGGGAGGRRGPAADAVGDRPAAVSGLGSPPPRS